MEDEPVEWEIEAALSKKRVNSEAILIAMVERNCVVASYGEAKRQLLLWFFWKFEIRFNYSI